MQSLPGYQQLKLVHQGQRDLVYSAVRAQDKLPVSIRQLRPEMTNPQLFHRYQSEYELLSQIRSAFIVRPVELIDSGDSPILVTERPSGESLAEILRNDPPKISQAAVISSLIARAINDLHSANIVHKDINPANIIYDATGPDLKLIDFSISVTLLPAQGPPISSGTLEGTLAYLAPEQTGRMNRSVDFRSDFYSLGITLYELLTGTVPFSGNDPLDLVYQHIAVDPVPPDELNQAVPDALSKITMKLLSKLPEDRYQSATAIVQDLETFIRLDREGRGETDFDVALDDIPEQFSIPERLLERDAHLLQLLSQLDLVASGRSTVVICTGETGIGKTALLHEFEREAIARGARLARGSHDPINTDVPYRAVSSALSDLARQLAGRPDFIEQRESLKRRLKGLAEPLLTLAPELTDMLGLQLSAPSGSHIDAKPRLERAITVLVQTICSDERPLVISLDNIQWIDSASLDLFANLFNKDVLPSVMLIGTFCANDLEPSHPNRMQIEQLLARNDNVQLIGLEALSESAINHLLSGFLFRSEEETSDFAALIREKTGGNPLCIREFLTRLNSNGQLVFDRRHREWSWNIQDVSAEPTTDNVSLALVDQLQDLDGSTAQILKIASCIGIEFELEIIQMVAGLPLPETASKLSNAVHKGYLLQIPNDYQSRDKRILFRFSHERVQQTAYGLLDTAERHQFHSSIGHALLQLTRGDLEPRIFDIVNQLNTSYEVPGNTQLDQLQLAELNTMAGRKARSAGAFHQAFKHFSTAIVLLGQNAWVRYDKALETHLEAANAAYLYADEKQLDELTGRILAHARSPLDRAAALETRIRFQISTFRLGEAVNTAVEGLASIDVVLKDMTHPSTLRTVASVLTSCWRLSRQGEFSLPTMTDEKHLAAMKLLMLMTHAAYISNDQRITRIVLEMADLSLRHGMAPESSFAFPALGSVLINNLGTIDFGYRLGQIALDNLTDENSALHCRTLVLAHNFNLSWKDHLNATLEPMADAYILGMESGDIEYALIAAVSGSANAFFLGHDLFSIEKNLAEQSNEARRHQQISMDYMGRIYQQAALNLLQSADSPFLLKGTALDEADLLRFQELKLDDSTLANLFIVKLYLAVLFRQDDLALDYADIALTHLNAVASTPVIPCFRMLETIACIQALSNSAGPQRIGIEFRIWRNLRLMRHWAHHAPANIAHRFHFIRAELAASRGQDLRAMSFYEQALEDANRAGYINDVALIAECCGRFHLRYGRNAYARYHISIAIRNYQRWGAEAKARALQNEFPEMTDRLLNEEATGGFVYSTNKNLLDLETVTRASQVLAGEVVLERVLERLLQTALLNAGGHCASLILRSDDELRVEITTWMNDSETESRLNSLPVTESDEVPISIIQYVARTREDLVLNDAVNDDIFTQDQYILRDQPQSIICIPIESQSQLIGILYVENSHSTHAFSQERVSVLKLLAAQSSIALANASLYQQLSDSRNKYLSLYENAVEGIFEVDAEGNLTKINPAGLTLLGYRNIREIRQAIQSRITSFFLEPEDFKEIQRQISAHGRINAFETRLVRADGKPIWVALSAQVASDPLSGSKVLEGSMLNIDERKARAEAEQARLVAEAQTATKSQFLANMSHEIRTPMNAILGYTDIMLETELDEARRANLQTIQDASNHLLHVVNDILDLSKFESGKISINRAPFTLSSLFREMENLFRLEARRKSLNLEVPVITPTEEPTLEGDSVRIGQVLINLLSNALKFTETGSVRLSYTAEDADNDEVLLRFQVNDTGIGIDSESLGRIFDTFEQGNTASAETGTGLGLSISRKLAEAMGGSLCADSEPGQGSTFTFTTRVSVLAAATIEPAPQQPAHRAPLPATDLLLVEDNEINQRLASRLLENMGMVVTIAADGQEALDMLAEKFYPIILMDIRMPRMDGIATIKAIRADPGLRSVAVIALSAGVLASEIEEAMNAGFDDYLTKPLIADAIYRVLAGIVGIVLETKTASPKGTLVVNGIDFGHAIENHSGDIEFMMSLTADFIDIYGDSGNQIGAMLAIGEVETAQRLAHNLAGISGSFGANALMVATRSLEKQIAEAGSEREACLASVTKELSNFTAAIEEFRSQQAVKG